MMELSQYSPSKPSQVFFTWETSQLEQHSTDNMKASLNVQHLTNLALALE